jgi:hypothetical protein
VEELVAAGKALPEVSDRLHLELDEFLRALDNFPKWTPGNSGWGEVKSLKRPSLDSLKKAFAAVSRVKDKANRCPGTMEVALLVLGEATTADEASRYGLRVVGKFEGIIYGRDLEAITGECGRLTAETVGTALRSLRSAIENLAGDGNAEDGKPAPVVRDRLESVRSAIAELRRKAGILSNTVGRHRPRVELACKELDRLEQNLAKLRLR